MNHTIQQHKTYTSNSTDPRSTTKDSLRALRIRLHKFSTYEPLPQKGTALPQSTYLLEGKRPVITQIQEMIHQYKALFGYIPEEIYLSHMAMQALLGLVRISYIMGVFIPVKLSGSAVSAEVTLVGARLVVAQLTPPLTGKEYTSYGQRARTR